MAAAKTHRRRRSPFGVIVMIAVFSLALCAMTMVFTNQAQGFGTVDSSVIGIGENRSSDETLSTEERFASDQSVAESATEVVRATDTAQRSITVKDPDPVVVPVAVDNTNDKAVEMANKYCTLDPLPTAPRVAPDTTDGTWSAGTASAYSIADNDDGKGNFGVTNTASGIDLSNESITVAVPESQSWRLGQICEICYDGKVVIATVTDTGGFAKYGRDLDLAPGVYKAFGASSVTQWGTRTVSYRFLD